MEIVIQYQVPTTFTVVVERDELPDQRELLQSITRDEISNGDGELTWDDIKYAWREADPEQVYISDTNYDELYI